jgi:hypothetical protein
LKNRTNRRATGSGSAGTQENSVVKNTGRASGTLSQQTDNAWAAKGKVLSLVLALATLACWGYAKHQYDAYAVETVKARKQRYFMHSYLDRLEENGDPRARHIENQIHVLDSAIEERDRDGEKW